MRTRTAVHAGSRQLPSWGSPLPAVGCQVLAGSLRGDAAHEHLSRHEDGRLAGARAMPTVASVPTVATVATVAVVGAVAVLIAAVRHRSCSARVYGTC